MASVSQKYSSFEIGTLNSAHLVCMHQARLLRQGVLLAQHDGECHAGDHSNSIACAGAAQQQGVERAEAGHSAEWIVGLHEKAVEPPSPRTNGPENILTI